MKRFAFVVIGFLFIAAPIYMKYGAHPVYINGNLLGNAISINGNLALPLEDLARALAGTPDFQQAGFQVRGGTLTLSPAVRKSNSSDTLARAHMQDIHFVMKVNKASPTLMLMTHDGKSYLSLSEVARLFGGTFTAPATLNGGAPIQLNFTANPNAIIAVR